MTEQTDSARPMCIEDIEYSGLTAGEYAAIALRVPKSGEEWLDAMIREANRMRLAGQAMSGNGCGSESFAQGAEWCVGLADAVLAELDKDHVDPRLLAAEDALMEAYSGGSDQWDKCEAYLKAYPIPVDPTEAAHDRREAELDKD